VVRDQESGSAPLSEDPPSDPALKLEYEGEVAADYLEGLLDIIDLDGDIDMDVEGDRASVSIVGDGLEHLVGQQGEVLEALQDLTRLAVLTKTGERTRLMLDIAGYRARCRERTIVVSRETIHKVVATQAAVSMIPMNPFERKIVHDAVAAAGLHSESDGEGPERHVVVFPESLELGQPANPTQR
jgi:spoIIIJ-associated protein